MKKYTVLYVQGGSSKQISFSSKKKALAFASPIIKADSSDIWVDGLVVGEFFRSKLNGKDKAIHKRLK
jgi:hypothetical protein